MRNANRLFRSACAIVTVALAAGPAFSQQILTSAAGGGPDGVPATSANLSYLTGVAIAPSGDIYVATWLQGRIFRVGQVGQHVVADGHLRHVCHALIELE